MSASSETKPLPDNPPRPYNLADPNEMLRLHRECWGYLHTCHNKHGTDWEGRKYAMDALNKLAQWPAKKRDESASVKGNP